MGTESFLLQRRELRRLIANFRSECDSAALYQALAGIERHSSLGRAFQRLADQEREHAAFWARCLRARHQSVAHPPLSLRTRLLTAAARRLGVGVVIPWITARELQDRRHYAQQGDALAAGLPRKEHAHAIAMRAISVQAAAMPSSDGAASLQNRLRAAVLAASDGLTSNFCLLMGVAGGGAQRSTILLTGVAGLVAGACSMGLGEWLSLTNAHELSGAVIDQELDRLGTESEPPTGNALTATESAAAAGARQPSQWRRPLTAASVSFVLFAWGALVPLLPFFWTSSRLACAVWALSALFVLGVSTSFLNGRGPLYSGIRQLVIGAAAAALTYTAGWLFGTLR
jgi:VIT1/CCC1 family predicted Fe2+/Mn2+ transporter